MAELEATWTDLLDKASLTAIEDGRIDVADYLRLKLANDTVRRSAVDWLFQTLIDQAVEAERNYPLLKIDRVDPHSFKIGTSNMVGSKIEVQCGVRCLSLEAGWARTPSDGIMRNGALALARVSHFGMSSEDARYRLIRGTVFPVWIDDHDTEIHADEIYRHLQLVLDARTGFVR